MPEHKLARLVRGIDSLRVHQPRSASRVCLAALIASAGLAPRPLSCQSFESWGGGAVETGLAGLKQNPRLAGVLSLVAIQLIRGVRTRLARRYLDAGACGRPAHEERGQDAPEFVGSAGEHGVDRRHGRRDAGRAQGTPCQPVDPSSRFAVRRALIAADLIGLSIAFVTAELVVASSGDLEDRVGFQTELFLFLATLPVWVFVANLYRLYDHDETRADHSTVDEIVGVFHLVTVGAWLLFAGAWFTGLADPNLTKITTFWALAILLVTTGRALARTIARRRPAYEQSALIIGAGHVGQLVARKLTQHPEYRITVVGFVDDSPRKLRPEVENLPVLGSVGEVPQLVRAHRVDRVIVAFLINSHAQMLELIRQLTPLGVQIELVPRYFEVIGPSSDIDPVEGLPLVCLGSPRISRSSRVFEANDRPRRRFDRARAGNAGDGRDRDRDQARLAWADPLPPDQARGVDA